MTYFVPTNTDVGSGAGRKLHTSRDCGGLAGANNVREANDGEALSFDKCKICTGEIDRSPCSRDHLNALKDAASEG